MFPTSVISLWSQDVSTKNFVVLFFFPYKRCHKTTNNDLSDKLYYSPLHATLSRLFFIHFARRTALQATVPRLLLKGYWLERGCLVLTVEWYKNKTPGRGLAGVARILTNQYSLRSTLRLIYQFSIHRHICIQYKETLAQRYEIFHRHQPPHTWSQ